LEQAKTIKTRPRTRGKNRRKIEMKSKHHMRVRFLVGASALTALALASAMAAGAAQNDPKPVASLSSQAVPVESLIQKELARAADSNGAPLDDETRAAVKVASKLTSAREAAALLGVPVTSNDESAPDRLVWIISVDAYLNHDAPPEHSPLSHGWTDVFEASTGEYICSVYGGGVLF
jgi:hypothetical protein